MAHPQMFDDNDPLLAQVRELALAFPGSDMKVSHGRPAFFTKKIFAIYGGSLKRDGDWEQHERWEQHEQSLLVFPESSDAEALRQDERCFVPAYWGPWGWVGIDLDESTDWTEITELLDASFRLTATKKLIAELDAG